MPSLAPIAATFGLLAGGLGLAGYLGFLPGGCGACCTAPPAESEVIAPGAVSDGACGGSSGGCLHAAATPDGSACPDAEPTVGAEPVAEADPEPEADLTTRPDR